MSPTPRQGPQLQSLSGAKGAPGGRLWYCGRRPWTALVLQSAAFPGVEASEPRPGLQLLLVADLDPEWSRSARPGGCRSRQRGAECEPPRGDEAVPARGLPHPPAHTFRARPQAQRSRLLDPGAAAGPEVPPGREARALQGAGGHGGRHGVDTTGDEGAAGHAEVRACPWSPPGRPTQLLPVLGLATPRAPRSEGPSGTEIPGEFRSPVGTRGPCGSG